MGGTIYLAGDGAVRNKDNGYFRITGRIDDVLNVSGHRMGTMEIESALVAHSTLVAEAAVVGRPDDLTGEAIVAFVVLKRSRPTGDEAKAIAKELRDWVGKQIGPIAKPKEGATTAEAGSDVSLWVLPFSAAMDDPNIASALRTSCLVTSQFTRPVSSIPIVP